VLHRLKAATLHLIASAIIVGIVLCMIFFIWYPQPFYTFHETSRVVNLIIIVDLVLGPLLTLVVFNIKKPRKELFRDISVIVLIQLVALSWGVHISYKMRPLFALYYDGAFYSITRVDIDMNKLSKDVTSPGVFDSPRILYMRDVGASAYFNQMVDIFTKNASDVMYQAEKYEEINGHLGEIADNQIDKNRLTTEIDKKDKVEAFLAKNNLSIKEYGFYPIYSNDYVGTLIVDLKNMIFIGVVDVHFPPIYGKKENGS